MEGGATAQKHECKPPIKTNEEEEQEARLQRETERGSLNGQMLLL